jgi:4'-phosphopantetheinyl transferase
MEPEGVTLQSTLMLLPPAPLLSRCDPLTLVPDTIHVWGFALEGDPEVIERCHALLSSAERQRADRFVFVRDRTRYIVAHGVLRRLLARYCGDAAESLTFETSPTGKPVLRNASVPHFNLTHSENGALLGVSASRELGIDLERVRANIEAHAISSHYFFGSERAAIAASATPDITFFRYWVAKEAVLKAQGIGLGFPLDRFHVAFFPGDEVARIDTFDPTTLSGDWTVRMLPCSNGWLAAVASRGTDWSVKLEGL